MLIAVIFHCRCCTNLPLPLLVIPLNLEGSERSTLFRIIFVKSAAAVFGRVIFVDRRIFLGPSIRWCLLDPVQIGMRDFVKGFLHTLY